MIVSLKMKSGVILPAYCILFMMSIDALSKFTTIVCLSGILILSGCKSTKSQPSTESPQKSLHELTQEKYGSSAITTYNKSKTHALVSKVQKDKNAAFASVDFFIYEASEGEIILEDFINQGKVAWQDNNQIRVSVTTGVPQEGASAGYVFNVTTRKKSPIKN